VSADTGSRVTARRYGDVVQRLTATDLAVGTDVEPIVALDGTVENEALAGLPAVVVGVDVAPGPDRDLAAVEAAVAANPVASVALAVLLRGTLERSIGEGLAAESATYAALQAGAEHERWLDSHRRAPRPADGGAPVRVVRDGDRLHVTLCRPDVHNAFNAAMRDALVEALAIAAVDTGVRVVIDGAGASFCSGGDLTEFGTVADPATAHLIRLARSAGRAIAAVADRVTVHVHGTCVGAGVELAAFAGRVVARPDATFRLPEVAMGLVPGAGGTVSIPRRIGRQRTAWLALTGEPIDVATALAWGLVDAVEPTQDDQPASTSSRRS
jgi:enoyl-CoA hydratase/carnithine racemase